MRNLYWSLLSDGCHSCGKPHGASVYTSSGGIDSMTKLPRRGGLFCSRACIDRGPVRLESFEKAVAAELVRRGVLFLPQQCIRRLVVGKFKYDATTAVAAHSTAA